MNQNSKTIAASYPDGVGGLLYSRRSIYVVLIAISTALMLAQVARVDSADPKNPTPFLSANDRSRWATIRALGDDGTYAIDHIIFDKQGNRVRGWHTIDLVKHRDADGEEHYYSSKPTLLTTLLAGEYWLIKSLTGATLAEQPFYIARLMLILTNVLPLAGALVILARLIERLGTTDWGRIFAVAAACFATFMTTFAVTLNNHVAAAISLVLAIVACIPIICNESRSWWRFAAVGLALGFVAANELPALSLLVFTGVGLAWLSPLKTSAGFVPAVLVVAAGAFGTNYLAHGDWRTPYAHRSDGPRIGVISAKSAESLNQKQFTPELRSALAEDGLNVLGDDGIALSPATTVEVRDPHLSWKLWDPETRTELALRRGMWVSTGPDAIHIHRWDNWYDYEGSYWLPESLRGIDVGEFRPLAYAFNVLIGHHGLFSLTPIWLLSAVGCWMWLARGDTSRRVLAITTVVITIVVVGFYLTRPQIDRNYGGGTCCLRWLLWLTPLWLLTLLPAADWLSKGRSGRAIVVGLLIVSVFSAAYAADNPWSHPWIFDYWTAMGWITY